MSRAISHTTAVTSPVGANYKSFAESLVESEMSEYEQEQTLALLQGTSQHSQNTFKAHKFGPAQRFTQSSINTAVVRTL